MKTFLKSLLTAILALALFVGLVVGLFIGAAAALGPKPILVPNKAVLVFDLNRTLPYGVAQDDTATTIQKAMDGDMDQATPLPLLIDALDTASDDPKISGLFITGNIRGSGPAALLELRQALMRFKEKKPVVAYNQSWDRNDLYLCSGLGNVIANPFGVVGVNAPTASMMFFAKAFDKYGVQVQVTKVGKYKSAVEPYVLDRMSPENREQVTGYLGEVWNVLKAGMAEGRGLEPGAIQALADTKGILDSNAALGAKLVDKLAHYDEVLNELKEMSGKKATAKDFPQIDMDTYAKMPNPKANKKSKNRISVVVAEGQIVDGEGKAGEIGGDALARRLRAIRMDKDVKAVVLCVNSPGGSATASDVIQRELVALKQDNRPLVVSMGNVAASGGYWISTVADRIFAEPNTITGSIGVFGMLPNAKKLANDHGITTDSVQMAKIGMPSLLRPLTPEEVGMVQALVDSVYDEFLAKVSSTRGLEKAAVHEIAQGRVWSGRKALELKLVDELGGLDAAIKHAAVLARIDNYRLDAPDAPKSTLERIMGAFGGGEKRRLTKAGPYDAAKNELEAVLSQLRSMNDPNGIYALAPMGMTIK
jgi:protease-4